MATETTTAAVSEHYADERLSALSHGISLLARLAGLFHDFGKASPSFQAKLRSPENSRDEIRHEYISALFLAHAGRDTQSNEEFLRRLGDLQECRRPLCMDFGGGHKQPPAGYITLDAGGGIRLGQLSTACRMLTMLCLTHHLLPVFSSNKSYVSSRGNVLDQCLSGACPLTWKWGYVLNAIRSLEQPASVKIAEHSPYHSLAFTRQLLRSLDEFLRSLPQLEPLLERHADLMFHHARLSLMLSDHVYSSGSYSHHHDRDHDARYAAWANTACGHQPLQYLDNHLCQVSRLAAKFGACTLNLREELPGLTAGSSLTADTAVPRFVWQNKACSCTAAVDDASSRQGFFGINIASTGCGKTIANARIMHTLSRGKGCRFVYATPLRTLTRQTGQALRRRLGLDSEAVVIKIGGENPYLTADNPSRPDAQLKDAGRTDAAASADTAAGTAADHDALDAEAVQGSDLSLPLDDQQLLAPAGVQQGMRSRMLERLLRCKFGHSFAAIAAPVLVCTVDYLAGASEGTRGGRQILGLLRLLSGDVILDEPDELDLHSQGAMCRLAFFAGLCGSRLIISSASLQPSLVQALFAHYRKGHLLLGQTQAPEQSGPLICGVFSEFVSATAAVSDEQAFAECYAAQVKEHVRQLRAAGRSHQRAAFLPLSCPGPVSRSEAALVLADAIEPALQQLARQHNTCLHADGPRITTALVRFANIDTLVQTGKLLAARDAPEGTCVHYCIYHARFTAAQRALIEEMLQQLLCRSQDSAWSEHEVVRQALTARPQARAHLFVVLASPVIEIGRDLDFDCAILEPSSFRSLVQASGRVQRHRQLPAAQPNILILSRNFSSLVRQGQKGDLAYTRPGYETKEFHLGDWQIDHGLSLESIDPICGHQLLTPAPAYTGKLTQIPDLITLERMASADLCADMEKLFLNCGAHYFGQCQKLIGFREDRDEGPARLYQLRGTAAERDDGMIWIRHRPWPGARVSHDCAITWEHDEAATGRNVSFFGHTGITAAVRRLSDHDQLRPEEHPGAQVSLLLHPREYANLSAMPWSSWRYSEIFGFYRRRD